MYKISGLSCYKIVQEREYEKKMYHYRACYRPAIGKWL